MGRIFLQLVKQVVVSQPQNFSYVLNDFRLSFGNDENIYVYSFMAFL